MVRRILAVVGAAYALSIAPARADDTPTVTPATIGIVVEVVGELQAIDPPIDDRSYVEYVRGVVHELIPDATIVDASAFDAPRAPHLFAITFSSSEPRGSMVVGIEMKVRSGDAYQIRMDDARTATFPIGDDAAARAFLSLRVTALAAQYGLTPSVEASGEHALASDTVPDLVPLVHPDNEPSINDAAPPPSALPPLVEGAFLDDHGTPPDEAMDASTQRTFWQRPYRIIGTSGIAAGAIMIGVGSWQGIVSLYEREDYERARSQLDAFGAKHRSESAAGRANILFAVGGIVTAAGGAVFVLDLLEIIGGSYNAPQTATLRVAPMRGGVVGTFTITAP